MRKLALTLALPALLASATASAHFNLAMPPASTNNTGGGKGAPPCGPDTTEGTPMAVTGGTDLPLTINETVRHGGFYRIALALTSCHTGANCFPADNVVYDAGGKVLPITGPGSSDHADFEMPAKFPVLADNLFPHPQDATAGSKPPATTSDQPTWTGTVPIPNLTCDKCTLQVIEFMHPHGPNAGGGYFYHHCADLKITADPGKPLYDPNGTGGTGGSGGTGGAATGGGGAGGAATAGAGAGGVATGGTAAGGTGTSGTGNPVGGTPTTGGASSTAGTTTTPAAGTAGTGTTTTAASDDSGGCGVAKRTQGGATALAALGLLFALVRRRRAR